MKDLNLGYRLACGGKSGLRALLILCAVGVVIAIATTLPKVVWEWLFYALLVIIGLLVAAAGCWILWQIGGFLLYTLRGELFRDIVRLWRGLRGLMQDYRELRKQPRPARTPLSKRIAGIFKGIGWFCKQVVLEINEEGLWVFIALGIIQLASWGACIYLYANGIVNAEGVPFGYFLSTVMLVMFNLLVGKLVFAIWKDLDDRYLPTDGQRIIGIIATLNIPAWSLVLALFNGWNDFYSILLTVAIGLFLMAVVLGLVYQCKETSERTNFFNWKR